MARTADPPQTRDRAREILDAARRCFARLGYHKTSIKTIAHEAGIRSPSILHYHFESKQAIFLAVTRDALGTLAERATALGLEISEGPRALGAIDAFFGLIDQEPDLAPLLIECMSMGLRGEPTRGQLAGLLDALEEMVEDSIRRLLGSAANRLVLDPKTLASTVLDLLAGHVMRTALGRQDGVIQERHGIRTLLGLIRPEPTDEDPR